MPRIDSHQHFWKYSPEEYPWIQDSWPLRRDFLPKDLEPLLRNEKFDACIAVQARQTRAESEWLLDLAKNYPFIAGVVGWVDLRASDVAKDLAALSSNRKFAGVRHVVQDEPDDRFLLDPSFQRGIAALEPLNLSYDLLIFPRQLPAAIELVKRFPRQRFVLDHIAKPLIKDGTLEPWRQQIRELATAPNVSCKLSGLVTEARWRGWRAEDFTPYFAAVWEAFGEDRLMIGSDWPVCLLSADYAATLGLVSSFLSQFSPDVREKVMGSNAIRFYRLQV
ncbi:MAG TPA: amidohydrolase family protein [Verrucomicrobiae bacterium]|nr:amidohydrolase family protein [Verrucomicrobiae bacterium]